MSKSSGGLIGKVNKPSGGGNVVTKYSVSGTFTAQKNTTQIDIAVSAGGGGGGSSGPTSGGGGGAGGLVYQTQRPIVPGTPFPITVGAGGAGGSTPNPGATGSDSVFGSAVLTAKGGGSGGGGPAGGGGDGGSGGAGAGKSSAIGAAGSATQTDQSGDSGTFGYGNDGATGGDPSPGHHPHPTSTYIGAGGGGGASGAGTQASPGGGTYAAGAGGGAKEIGIRSTTFNYSGGGGGAAGDYAPGGKGGLAGAENLSGGFGGSPATTSQAGGENTGGGGGGAFGAGSVNPAPTTGAAGGSGLIDIKELDKASGVWDMKTHYLASLKGQWPTQVPYEIGNSLRFAYGDDPKLKRTVATSGSAKVGTMSFWMKLGTIRPSNTLFIISADQDSSNYFNVGLLTGGTLRFRAVVSGSEAFKYQPSLKLRDHSAWYHICFAIDTAESDGNDGTKVYVNGKDLYANYSIAYTQNMDIMFNKKDVEVRMGMAYDESEPFDGYLSDFHWIDGQVLNAGHFGEPDKDNPNIWRPKKYEGTYGTNGFLMEFKQSSVGTGSTTTIGADTSGNLLHLDSTNVAVTDQTTDTPTNNFCTLNILDNFIQEGTFAEGNCKLTTDASNYSANSSTMAAANGKWYFEAKCTTVNDSLIGISGQTETSASNGLGQNTNQHGYLSSGNARTDGNDTSSGYASYTDDDIISVAFDCDNNKVYFGKGGTWQNSADPAAGSGGISITAAGSTATGFYTPGFGDNGSSAAVWEANFGSPPFAISSGNADANGYGNFEYAVPSGFYALCSKNLAQYG